MTAKVFSWMFCSWFCSDFLGAFGSGNFQCGYTPFPDGCVMISFCNIISKYMMDMMDPSAMGTAIVLGIFVLWPRGSAVSGRRKK
jgi:hypothetical protein